MSPLDRAIELERHAPIPTWFRVGGGADRLARPRDAAELVACLEDDAHLRVLGDGANLLVADGGVRELVVKLDRGAFAEVTIDAQAGLVRAGAGFDLAKLIHLTVREGLVGLQGLIGVPATIGGAVRMNAGGAFGQIADHIERVHAMRRDGALIVLERSDIAFGYRTSGLDDLIVIEAELRLERGSAHAARDELKRIMAAKSASQPLASTTCGCVFRNPTLHEAIPGIGEAGDRVGAGLLIDRAGGKGIAEPGCAVSHTHANFIETGPDATATAVLRLIDRVRALVRDRFGVALETEVVVWGAQS
ncbi:MAG: UDP-N-acetylmuramate dehydrogenase [Phycisphaerales bacterium]